MSDELIHTRAKRVANTSVAESQGRATGFAPADGILRPKASDNTGLRELLVWTQSVPKAPASESLSGSCQSKLGNGMLLKTRLLILFLSYQLSTAFRETFLDHVTFFLSYSTALEVV